MKLVLGVLDVGYAEANGSGSSTTGDVAEILESQYGVMATFVEMRRDRIAGMLADSMANAIADLVAGKPVDTAAPTFEGEQKIETEFRAFIYSNTMQKTLDAASQFSNGGITGVGGVISKAAQAGVSHRKKHPYAKKNKPRPAFVDTGLYVQSFRAWVIK